MFSSFKRNIGVYAAATGLFLLEFIKLALVAFITIFLVRYFLFKPFYVKGASMEPNFHESEYLIIDEACQSVELNNLIPFEHRP